MNSRFNKGFTLIELLVVVAIIGILSSIILVSLSSARNKGRDAAAKGSMSSMRATAELFFDTNNSYGGSSVSSVPLGATAPASADDNVTTAASICDYNPILSLAHAVYKQVNVPVTCTVTIGGSSAGNSSYTLSTQLNDGLTYCVDSSGFAGSIEGTTGGAINGTPGETCM